jgi:hypothetical protein
MRTCRAQLRRMQNKQDRAFGAVPSNDEDTTIAAVADIEATAAMAVSSWSRQVCWRRSQTLKMSVGNNYNLVYNDLDGRGNRGTIKISSIVLGATVNLEDVGKFGVICCLLVETVIHGLNLEDVGQFVFSRSKP